jgi:hypothetical protein
VYALLAVVCAVWAWPVTAGSPVEGTILFQSDRTGAWRMYRLLPDGTDTELLPGANWTTTQRPRVTRDGKFVVFEGNQDKSTTDVYMMAIDGSGLRRVTDTALNVFFPVLSPDGTKIAFEMDTQLWVVSVAGIAPLSGSLAKMAAASFQMLGMPSMLWTDVSAIRTRPTIFGPQDVVIAISHSGESTSLVDFLADANEKGATTIALVNYLGSSIARVARIKIVTRVREGAVENADLLPRPCSFSCCSTWSTGCASGAVRVRITRKRPEYRPRLTRREGNDPP